MTCPATGGEHRFEPTWVGVGADELLTPACVCGLTRESWLITQLATARRERDEARQALISADVLHLADEQTIRNLERKLAEAQAACAAMATLLSDCGEWFHDPPEDDGSSDAMLEHRIATLLVSSPGRPLLDELARLREALETVERTYYSTQTVPTPGQEAHVMALVRAAFSARSTP